MGNVSFTIEEENLICIYHRNDRPQNDYGDFRRAPNMDADMRPAGGADDP